MKQGNYGQLVKIMEENRTLGQGGLGQWRWLRPVGQMLAVNPWRVIIPAAVGITLLSWLVFRGQLTVMVLRIFGGP